jgi:hypothetical protein
VAVGGPPGWVGTWVVLMSGSCHVRA